MFFECLTLNFVNIFYGNIKVVAGLLKKSTRKRLQPKSCPDCGKQFVYESSLRQHRRIHLKIKLLSDPDAEDGQLGLESMPQIILICERCYCVFTSKEDLRDHKLLKHGESTSMILKDSISSSEVIDEQELMRRQFFKKCDYCPLNFKCPIKHFNHIETHIKKRKKDKLEEEKRKQQHPQQKKRKRLENNGESYQTCRLCYKAFTNRSQLRKHFRDGHSQNKKILPSKQKEIKQLPKEKLNCGYCKSICSNSIQLRKHVQLKHPDQVSENIFYCKPCTKFFPRINALHCHQFWKHKEELLKSKVANSVNETKITKPKSSPDIRTKSEKQKVGSKQSVKNPERQSVRVKDDKGTVKRVMTKFKDEKETEKEKTKKKESPKKIKLTCPTCNVECPNETALKVHFLEKHNTAIGKQKDQIIKSIPYRCNICNLNFTVQSSYEDHRRFHSLVEQTKRTYACNHCISSFSTLEQLKLHLENFHTKLQCHQCDKEFETPASLNIHIAVAHRKQKAVAATATTASSAHFEHYHSPLQPQMFKCQECDSVFEKVGSLNIHLVVVHEKQNMITDKNKRAVAVPTLVKRFACTICGLGFNDVDELGLHTEVAHSFRTLFK